MAQEVTRGSFEKFEASSWRVGIVVAQFNRDITDGLLASAQKMLADYRVVQDRVLVTKVAGSVEIPVVLKAMAASKKFDVLVAVGCIIRGETPHFDFVAKFASEGVLRVMMDYGIPVGFGVLTCENKQQAKARLHVGGESVEAALQAKKAMVKIADV